MQNKIDRLILNGNHEFSEQRNVVAALVEYSRCLDLFDFIDRNYEIQSHELLVRIAICYDILGNFNKTIEFLNKALSIVPNVGSLILYKSVLLQTLGKTDDAQKILVKYKQLSGKKNKDLYETFRLVFYYSMQLEKEVLLREINKYLEKYEKNAVILYLRAMIFLEMSNVNGNIITTSNLTQTSNSKNHQSDYYMKYEGDIKEALVLEPNDTEFLIKDGITNDNLTKLFFMILPDMDYYQPKPLVNYRTFHTGIKVIYIIMKAIKMFKIKVEKKKLKQFYSNKLKLFKKRLENSKSNCEISDNSNNYSNNNSTVNLQAQNDLKDNTFDKNSCNEGSSANTQTKTVITGNTSDIAEKEIKEYSDNKDSYNTVSSDSRQTKSLKFKLKSQPANSINTERNSNSKNKSPTIVNIKNNVEKANNDDIINEIKKEYEMKVKSLYKTVWLFNLRMNDNINFNYDVDIDANYFIKNKYYAPYNLKETILTGVKQNIEFKSQRSLSVDLDKNKNNSIKMNSNTAKNPIIVSNKSSSKLNPVSVNFNNIQSYNKFSSIKNEENFADFNISEINHRVPNQDYMNDPDTMSFSCDINIFEQNAKKDDLMKSSHAINNLRKMEIDK
jgi:hypothetical protein